MMKLINKIIVSVFLLLMLPPMSHSAVKVFAVKSSEIEPYNRAIRGAKAAFTTARLAEDSITVFGLEGDEVKWKEILKKVREERPHLIMTFGTFATELAKRDVKDVPIVFSTVLNPEESRIVESLGPHNGNVTGASLDVPFETQFSYILRIVPHASKIGVLYNPKETGGLVERARAAALKMGLNLVTEAVVDESSLPRAIHRLMGKIDVLWSVADSTVFSSPAVYEIIIEAIDRKIPFMGLSPSFVRAGALFSIKWDDTDIGRQAGETAIKVISMSENVSEIPVSTPRDISLSINLRTAKAIGITIPEKVLKRAEVFK